MTTARDPRVSVPPLPPRYAPRPRLLAALDQAAAAPLTLVRAGPGAGKTALLAQWAGSAGTRVAWVGPGLADGMAARFWPLVESALAQSGASVPAGAGSARDESGADRAWGLLGEVASEADPVVLIIDDADGLDDPGVLDGLDTLVRGQRPGLRLVLAARGDPGLPLHRYRLAGQLSELRAADLALTADEARDVLAAHGVTLAGRDLDRLLARTEGWAAGVRLSAMAMEGAADTGSLVTRTALGPGSAGEYLVEEVLRRLPARHRRLLVETSFLDEVTGPLADAVTGGAGSGDILAGLARDDCFVVVAGPLPARFRYHPMFGAVLRALLERRGEAAVRRLQQRAAQWFAASGDLASAIRWAARAGDGGLATRLVARGGLAHAFVRRLDLSEVEAELPRLRAAEPGGPEPDNPALGGPGLAITRDLAGLVLGQRAGDCDAVDAAAGRLLGDASDLAGLRAAVLLARASAHLWHGRPGDVGTLLDEALAAARREADHRLEAEILAMMAFAATFWSRAHQAQEATRRARDLCGRHRLAAPAALDLATGLRALVAGDLAAGAARLERIAPPTGVAADPGLAAALALGRAGALLVRGKEAQARAILAGLGAGAIPPVPRVYRDVLLARLDTARGRPRAAVTRLEQYRGTGLDVLAATACARAHLAQGDPRGARDCVRTALTTPSALAGSFTVVDALLCDAQATLEAGDHGQALEIVVRAIEVATDDIRLPFLWAGHSFDGLLARHPDVAAQWPLAPRAPLPALSLVPGPRPPRDLPDPLTPRELTILRFLATSMSTAEIAQELCLSVNTIKTHLSAIYRKLTASRRREAVQRARELELI